MLTFEQVLPFERDIVTLKKLNALFFKCLRSMMFFLVLNVLSNHVDL